MCIFNSFFLIILCSFCLTLWWKDNVTTLPSSELGTAMIHFKRIYYSCEFSSFLNYKLLQVRSETTFYSSVCPPPAEYLMNTRQSDEVLNLFLSSDVKNSWAH